MKNTFKTLAFGLITAVLLTACAGGASIGGVGTPGGARDASTREIGANTQLVYMASGDMEAACEAQSKLITAANYTLSGQPDISETYQSATFTSGGATLTLMCSEERDGGNLVGTKVTMTLQGGSK